MERRSPEAGDGANVLNRIRLKRRLRSTRPRRTVSSTALGRTVVEAVPMSDLFLSCVESRKHEGKLTCFMTREGLHDTDAWYLRIVPVSLVNHLSNAG